MFLSIPTMNPLPEKISQGAVGRDMHLSDFSWAFLLQVPQAFLPQV